MLPQLLSTLFVIVMVIKHGERCGDALGMVFLSGPLYPLLVPARTIVLAGRQLLSGENKENDLAAMKGMKMFEHLGQYFLFIIL